MRRPTGEHPNQQLYQCGGGSSSCGGSSSETAAAGLVGVLREEGCKGTAFADAVDARQVGAVKPGTGNRLRLGDGREGEAREEGDAQHGRVAEDHVVHLVLIDLRAVHTVSTGVSTASCSPVQVTFENYPLSLSNVDISDFALHRMFSMIRYIK